MLKRCCFQNEVKLSKKNLRRELVNLIVVIVSPLISLLLYWKIAGDDFFGSGAGQLLLIIITLVSAITASSIYEHLFPKYKDDVLY